MTYSPGTGSYESDFLEHILDTDFRYDIPYKVDKEKYLAVVEEYLHNTDIRIKDADVLIFHSDYVMDDEDQERGVYGYTFYAWPQNSPKGSKDFYDCFTFWDWEQENKHKENFEAFVRAILKSIICPDKEYMNKLKDEMQEKKKEIEEQTNIINDIYNQHFTE